MAEATNVYVCVIYFWQHDPLHRQRHKQTRGKTETDQNTGKHDGPRLWNSLPSNLRLTDRTLQQFRWALKTYQFG